MKKSYIVKAVLRTKSIDEVDEFVKTNYRKYKATCTMKIVRDGVESRSHLVIPDLS